MYSKWMNLKNLMLRRTHTEKHTYCTCHCCDDEEQTKLFHRKELRGVLARGTVGYNGEDTALHPSWNAGNRGVYSYQNSANSMSGLWSYCSKLYHQKKGHAQCHRTPCIRNQFQKKKIEFSMLHCSYIFSTANAAHVQAFQPRWVSFSIKTFFKIL